MRFISKLSQTALSITLLGTLSLPLAAQAYPTCGDLFQSRDEGLLLNRAARAAMLQKLRVILPAGRHPITNDGETQTLGVFYSNLGDVYLTLNSRSLVTSQTTPHTTGSTGLQSGVQAHIQLLPGNVIVISNTQIYGDAKKIQGLTTRETEMKFNLTRSQGHVMNVKETVTTESIYAPTQSYTTRSELTHSNRISDNEGQLSR